MRKILVLLALLGTIATTGRAQAPWYCITANQTGFGPGYQTFLPDNITVEVRRNFGGGGGGFGCNNISTYVNTPPGFCGVGPYQIGHKGCNSGWIYGFSTAITDIRIRMVSLHDSDSVRLAIPSSNPMGFPTTVPVTAGMMSAWTSACNGGFFAVPGVGGKFSATANAGYSDVQIDVQNPFPPYTFDKFQVDSRTSARDNNIDGSIYEICFKNDSCSLRFEVKADSPYCTGRPLKLHAPDYPNTIHHWKYSGGGGVWPPAGNGPSGLGLANVNVNNITLLHTGLYIDSATRGTCTYIDTIDIKNIDLTPQPPVFTQKGPKCPGEDDTLDAKTNLPGGGDYWFYGFPPSGTLTPYPAPGGSGYHFLPGITALDAGPYYVYAQTTQGCISDTTKLDVKVNPPVHASFSETIHLGCEGDTAFFSNFSVGSNVYNWDMGLASPPVTFTSISPDTFYVYHHHGVGQMPVAYNVKLTVGNGICADDTTITIAFDHPLQALFTADADSVCQYTDLNFVNNSVFTAATTPSYLWIFGDGATDNAVLATTHKYDRVGIYDVALIITDFLGCKDTAYHHLVVDSTGSIAFESSDLSLCAGDIINFNGSYSPVGINDAVWDFADGNKVFNVANTTHAYDEPGNYKVTFSADYRVCKDTVYAIDLVVKPYPIVDLGDDTTICPNGEPVRLTLKTPATPGLRYQWNTLKNDTLSDVMIYHPGTYSVTADLEGCTTTDSVRVFKKCFVDVPNVFTPNGDGTNDYFLPRELMSRGISKFNMTIYNRWGTIVFKTDKLDGRGWDGKFNGEDQQLGVYVYLIEAEFVNGSSEKYQGNITLLR